MDGPKVGGGVCVCVGGGGVIAQSRSAMSIFSSTLHIGHTHQGHTISTLIEGPCAHAFISTNPSSCYMYCMFMH